MNQHEIFRTESIPVLQNKMFDTEAAAVDCPKGDVILVQDTDTGLIFNKAFDAALLTYDSDYQNEQACSGIFQRHIGSVLDIIKKYFQKKTIIEIGCGKGRFLGHLRQSGYKVTGIDPAYEGDDPEIIKAPFDLNSGLAADGIVLRHVLEHVPDPIDFLVSIAEANGGKGSVYIEVPCFDWICRHRAWFDVYYEHVNYFRLSDFRKMFGVIFDAGYVFKGQYLYVVADLSTLKRPRANASDIIQFPKDFTASIQNILVASIAGTRKAVWGGAAKGMMFAYYMKRAGQSMDWVIDINPAKQGKYLPGTGLRVSSPNEAMKILKPGDDIYIMNSNYLGEIVATTNNHYHYIEVEKS
jgi:2-polyprenyl-3-methyl-5-hydroxy-6-metoxy-1,4-benzoquinol methylase